MNAAALEFARSLGLKNKNLVAVRVTGTAGLGGVFQCYEPCKVGQTSVGPNIHVMSDGACSKRESH